MIPWVLGETREHDYALCNKRDPQTFKMRCEACAVRDKIDGVVFHESAHITSDSFAPVDPEKITEMVKELMPFIDADSLKLPRDYKGRPLTVQASAAFIEPVYLPQVTNAVEDIYVNRRLYKHRPGTEKSNLVRTIEVFNEGFTTGDGTLVKWSEQPEGMQAIMAVYLLGCRLPHLIEQLADEVQVVRDDQVLIGEMEAVPDSGTPYDRAEIAFRVLARLRELRVSASRLPSGHRKRSQIRLRRHRAKRTTMSKSRHQVVVAPKDRALPTKTRMLESKATQAKSPRIRKNPRMTTPSRRAVQKPVAKRSMKTRMRKLSPKKVAKARNPKRMTTPTLPMDRAAKSPIRTKTRPTRIKSRVVARKGTTTTLKGATTTIRTCRREAATRTTPTKPATKATSRKARRRRSWTRRRPKRSQRR